MRNPLTVALLLCATALCGQRYVGVAADLGYFGRQGSWSERYGASLSVTPRAEFGLASGLVLGTRADFSFGNDVLEDPLAGLRTDRGDVLGDATAEAAPARVSLRSRGVRGVVYAGYRRPIGSDGWHLRATVGPSYAVHYIRIQDDPELPTSNLRDEYKRGYDRRAGGFGGALELGPEFVNANGSLRVFAVATLDVMSSSPLNSVQFDTRSETPAASTDTAIGLRAGFILGLQRTDSGRADDIYY